MQQTWRGCPEKRLLACVHCQIKLRLAPLALGLSLELKELELGLDSCSDAVNFNLRLAPSSLPFTDGHVFIGRLEPVLRP